MNILGHPQSFKSPSDSGRPNHMVRITIEKGFDTLKALSAVGLIVFFKNNVIRIKGAGSW